MFHLAVGRSQIEWKLKVKTQISVFPWAKIGQNDHSNPYIESTTVLSDNMVCFTVQQWKDVEQDKEDKMKLYCRSSSLNPL